MKVRLILLSAAIALSAMALAGCESDGTTTNTSGTAQNNEESPTDFSKDETGYPDIWDVLPYIEETSSFKFSYWYSTEYKGMVVTNYTSQSPKVRIPDTLEGEPVVGVDLRDCTITELIMPDTVVAFYVNTEPLEYINIPRDVEIFSLANAKNLISVYIQDGVSSIPYVDIIIGAFQNCESLTNIIFPDSIREISGGSFRYCTSLTNVVIPDGVTEIKGEWRRFDTKT